MSWTEFDCVVVGDELAAVWLLRQYVELAKKEKGAGEVRVGWIRLRPQLRPQAVPHFLREKLGLEAKAPFSAEIRTPKHDYPWLPDRITERYGFAPPAWGPLTNSEQSQLRYCFQRFPEVFDVGAALWARFGKSSTLSSEKLVESAFRLSQLTYIPLEELAPPQTTIFNCPPGETPLKKITRLKTGEISFEFAPGGADDKPIMSRHWILSSGFLEHQQWKSAGFDVAEYLGVSVTPPSHAFLEFSLEVDNAALSPRQAPITLWSDADQIPDPLREIWPMELERQGGDAKTSKLIAQAPVCFPFDVDTALKQMRESVKRITRLIPWLPECLRSVEFPLGIESCHSAETRAEIESRLWQNLHERYALSSLEVRTRHKGIYVLPASYHSELPYPLGPLRGAKEILIERFGRGEYQKVNVAALSPIH